MEKIIIEYHAQDNGQFSKLIMAAVMEILNESSVDRVLISQDDSKTGSMTRFAYARCGGNSNGL